MFKNVIHVPVFVYGATMTALGISMSFRDKVIVVEKSGLLAREFVDSFNPGSGWGKKLLSREADDLRAELGARNILSEVSRIHLPAVAPVLFKKIKDEKLNFLFMTIVTGIRDIGTGYEITLYNNSGFSRLTAGMIIDTTSLCEIAPSGTKKIKSKSINAVLSPADTNKGFPKTDNPLVEFIQGRFEDEVYLKYRLEVKDDWITARDKLHSFWITRSRALKDWNMSAAASSFAIKADAGPEEIRKNWFRNPSSAYGNLLEAYEAGILLNLKESINHATM